MRFPRTGIKHANPRIVEPDDGMLFNGITDRRLNRNQRGGTVTNPIHQRGAAQVDTGALQLGFLPIERAAGKFQINDPCFLVIVDPA